MKNYILSNGFRLFRSINRIDRRLTSQTHTFTTFRTTNTFKNTQTVNWNNHTTKKKPVNIQPV